MSSASLMTWAGVHPQTAYRWFREGTLPVPAVRVGSRSALVASGAMTAAGGGARGGRQRRPRPLRAVSSHDQKAGLGRQAARLAARAARAGQPAARVEAGA